MGRLRFIHATDVHIRQGSKSIREFFAAMKRFCLAEQVDFLVSTYQLGLEALRLRLGLAGHLVRGVEESQPGDEQQQAEGALH